MLHCNYTVITQLHYVNVVLTFTVGDHPFSLTFYS